MTHKSNDVTNFNFFPCVFLAFSFYNIHNHSLNQIKVVDLKGEKACEDNTSKILNSQ